MAVSAARDQQLQTALAAVDKNNLRPIVVSLNGDNSWLWSFPRPASERAATGKNYYHIVFEPWLNGPTSTISSWLIHICLPAAPAAATPEDVEAIARQIEAAASTPDELASNPANGDSDQIIDAILLFFHFFDHLHEPTLRLFDRRIPVIATPEAAAKIKPWKHFDTINIIPNIAEDAKSWRGMHPGGLPSWLTPMRIPGHTELNFVSALIWTHTGSDGAEVHETILVSPHGTRLHHGPLQAFIDSEPPTEKLAMFHGLKENRGAGVLNTYGAAGGLALYRKLGGTKYWLSSHSALFGYSGLVMRLLFVTDTPRTIEWALEQETLNEKIDPDVDVSVRPEVLEVGNGGCFILA